MSVIFSFPFSPSDSRLIRSVRASINVVSITAAAAPLSSFSPCQSGAGVGGRRGGGEEVWVRLQRRGWEGGKKKRDT